jgi:putative peptidoglycan lipid II flippase
VLSTRVLFQWIHERQLIRESIFSLVSNGVGRIAGFVGVIVIAAQYGANSETDIFFLILAVVLFITSLGQSFFDLWFIPAYLQQREQSAADLRALLGFVVGAIVCLGILLSIGSDVLVSHAAAMYGNYGTEDTARVFVLLTYEMSPLVVLYWLSGVGIAVLNAEQRFTAAGLMPSVPWISTIPFALYLKDVLGIHALSIGLIAGTSCQAMIVYVLLVRQGLAISFGTWHPATVQSRNGTSLFMGLSLFSAIPILDRILVSCFLPSGDVTALENATRLIQIPWTLATAGYINVFHTWWAARMSEGKLEYARSSFRKLFTISSIVFIPISFFLFWEGLPIVEFTFGRGRYSNEAIHATAQTFAYYCLGYWAFMLRSTVIRFYSAHQSTGVVLGSAIWDISVHLIAALFLIERVGIGGIGMASSLGYIASLVYAMSRHHRKRL